MSRFQVTVEIGDSHSQRFVPEQVWVDPDAAFSQFAAALLNALGYEPEAIQVVPLPDGRSAEMDIGDVRLRIGDEVRTITCIFDANFGEALLSPTTLQEFGLTTDSVAAKLVAE